MESDARVGDAGASGAHAHLSFAAAHAKALVLDTVACRRLAHFARIAALLRAEVEYAFAPSTPLTRITHRCDIGTARFADPIAAGLIGLAVGGRTTIVGALAGRDIADASALAAQTATVVFDARARSRVADQRVVAGDSVAAIGALVVAAHARTHAFALGGAQRFAASCHGLSRTLHVVALGRDTEALVAFDLGDATGRAEELAKLVFQATRGALTRKTRALTRTERIARLVDHAIAVVVFAVTDFGSWRNLADTHFLSVRALDSSQHALSKVLTTLGTHLESFVDRSIAIVVESVADLGGGSDPAFARQVAFATDIDTR